MYDVGHLFLRHNFMWFERISIRVKEEEKKYCNIAKGGKYFPPPQASSEEVIVFSSCDCFLLYGFNKK